MSSALHMNWRKIFKLCSSASVLIPIHITLTFARQSADLKTIDCHLLKKMTSVQNNFLAKFFRRKLRGRSIIIVHDILCTRKLIYLLRHRIHKIIIIIIIIIKSITSFVIIKNKNKLKTSSNPWTPMIWLLILPSSCYIFPLS